MPDARAAGEHTRNCSPTRAESAAPGHCGRELVAARVGEPSGRDARQIGDLRRPRRDPPNRRFVSSQESPPHSRPPTANYSACDGPAAGRDGRIHCQRGGDAWPTAWSRTLHPGCMEAIPAVVSKPRANDLVAADTALINELEQVGGCNLGSLERNSRLLPAKSSAQREGSSGRGAKAGVISGYRWEGRSENLAGSLLPARVAFFPRSRQLLQFMLAACQQRVDCGSELLEPTAAAPQNSMFSRPPFGDF
jgi:hypothetical protein